MQFLRSFSGVKLAKSDFIVKADYVLTQNLLSEDKILRKLSLFFKGPINNSVFLLSFVSFNFALTDSLLFSLSPFSYFHDVYEVSASC